MDLASFIGASLGAVFGLVAMTILGTLQQAGGRQRTVVLGCDTRGCQARIRVPAKLVRDLDRTAITKNKLTRAQWHVRFEPADGGRRIDVRCAFHALANRQAS